MLNVNKVTSQLAKMPDQALQQFATMHKGDPYMLTLALAESGRRKELRTAAQAAQGAQVQPKVVDQALADMSPQQLPENMGIGQLPAENLKGMAGGGIIAFEEGGEVPRFNGMDGSVPMSYEEQMSQLGQFLNPIDRFKRLIGAPGTKSREETFAELNKDSAERLDPLMKGYKSRAGADTSTQDTAPTRKVPVLEGGSGTSAPAVRSAPAARDGLESLIGSFKPTSAADKYAGLEAIVDKMSAKDKEAMEPFRKQFEQERTALSDRKKSNQSDALIQAGLAMMQGTSRNALQNIAEGAAKGYSGYKDANKADEAARRALTQSEMLLAQSEMQARKGNMGVAAQLENQARQEEQFGIQAGLQAQQIRQQGEYQRGMVGAANARNNSEAKIMQEYTKVQKMAAASVDKDIMAGLLRPEQKDAMIIQRTRALAADNPLLARHLAMGEDKAEDGVRELPGT
jgi:hypothetical protein